MKTIISGVALAALCLATPTLAQEFESQVPGESVRDLHDRVLTMDTHVDIDGKYATHELDPGTMTAAQVDLPKMRAGGLDAAFFIVYVGQDEVTEAGYAEARAKAEDKYVRIRRMLDAYPDQVELALTADDVERIAATGKRVALIGMENAYPLGPSVEDLEMWRDRGVRYVSITHMGHNQFGDSSNLRFDLGDEPGQNDGLTDLGRELVKEANRLGIMVDISHVGKQTTMQAMELSTAPVVASHSGAKAVSDNPRNLDDEQLRALAENGGVAQMVAFDSYVKRPSDARIDAEEAIRAEMGMESSADRQAASEEKRREYYSRIDALDAEFPPATVADVVDHIDHAVEVAGIDHVGISSDFDGGGGVTGWDNAAETPNVTAELVKRGYSEDEIEKLWGGNLRRVMRAVEAAAE